VNHFRIKSKFPTVSSLSVSRLCNIVMKIRAIYNNCSLCIRPHFLVSKGVDYPSFSTTFSSASQIMLINKQNKTKCFLISNLHVSDIALFVQVFHFSSTKLLMQVWPWPSSTQWECVYPVSWPSVSLVMP
jgi:hypothetical protein